MRAQDLRELAAPLPDGAHADGLFKAGLVEWVSSMTYQAASGAGANNMRELVAQMAAIGQAARPLLDNPASSALELEACVTNSLRSSALPSEHFGAPLAGSLIAWIDKAVADGQTKEEWKGFVEANKILGTKRPIPIDGICVRVGAMRCHAQGVTIKLARDVPLPAIHELLAEANPWVKLIPNEREATERSLSPAAVSGTLDVPVGRIHKLRMGPAAKGRLLCGLSSGRHDLTAQIMQGIRQRLTTHTGQSTCNGVINNTLCERTLTYVCEATYRA